jgi:hypothetical protein
MKMTSKFWENQMMIYMKKALKYKFKYQAMNRKGILNNMLKNSYFYGFNEMVFKMIERMFMYIRTKEDEVAELKRRLKSNKILSIEKGGE